MIFHHGENASDIVVFKTRERAVDDLGVVEESRTADLPVTTRVFHSFEERLGPIIRIDKDNSITLLEP
jgi:hypothetical protein